MNPDLFQRPIHRDKCEFAPKLTKEFDPSFIQSRALEYRNEQLELRWRLHLAKFGSAMIALGRHIQRLAHLPFAANHTSWKTVATHSMRVRNHK